MQSNVLYPTSSQIKFQEDAGLSIRYPQSTPGSPTERYDQGTFFLARTKVYTSRISLIDLRGETEF